MARISIPKAQLLYLKPSTNYLKGVSDVWHGTSSENVRFRGRKRLHRFKSWPYRGLCRNHSILKVDMPILTCIFFTFNWLTLTSEMHFVKFHPVVASCLLSRGKRKYAPLGMRLLWKYIRNYFLVYQLISPFLVYLQNYKEFEAEILDLQSEKYGLSFDIKKYTTSGWALGDENVIGIRAFKGAQSNLYNCFSNIYRFYYHKKAHTFLIIHGKFHSWKMFHLEDFNENVPGYVNHNYAYTVRYRQPQ